MSIEPGQIYRSLSNRHHPADGPMRIKVVSKEFPGALGYGKVHIVTLTNDGREIRRRTIEVVKLHDSDTFDDGKPRRTGYVLEKAGVQ